VTGAAIAETFLRRAEVHALLAADLADGAVALLNACTPRQFRSAGHMDGDGRVVVVADLECALPVLAASTQDDRQLLVTALGEVLRPAGYAVVAAEYYIPGSPVFTCAALTV
jgi:hypothetical protein